MLYCFNYYLIALLSAYVKSTLCYKAATQALTMSLQVGVSYYLRNVPPNNVLNFNYAEKVSICLTCAIFGPTDLSSVVT
jgi:hypothetical protein